MKFNSALKSEIAPILQIAYALVGAYRSLGVKHASRNPNQTPGLPPSPGEGEKRARRLPVQISTNDNPH
jgi:hypothetical protein